MPATTIILPNTWGGVSRQDDTIRHINQFEESDNVVPDVLNGAQKRPGSHHLAFLSGLTDMLKLKLHPIDRDDTEQYVIVCGHGVLRIFSTLTGVEQSVSVDAAVTTYLERNEIDSDDISRDDLALWTQSDTTYILNRKVSPKLGASSQFTVTATHEDFEAMIRTVPAAQTYHRTKFASTGRSSGYYQYNPFKLVGDGGLVNHAVVVGGNVLVKIKPAINLVTEFTTLFNTKIRLNGRADGEGGTDLFSITAIVNGDATNDAIQVSPEPTTVEGSDSTAQFELHGASWPAFIGPRVNSRWATASAYTKDPYHKWAMKITVTNSASVESTYNISGDYSALTFADMDAVAEKFTDTFNDHHANFIVQWVPEGNSGRMKIIAPFPGYGASISSPASPTDGSHLSLYDFASGGENNQPTPFRSHQDYSIEDGTGDATTMLPNIDARWTRVAAPGQIDATPDASTLPIIVERVAKGSVDDLDGTVYPAEFHAKLETWTSRQSGDIHSNPPAGIYGGSKKVLFLNDIAIIQNRLVFAAGDRIVMSQTDDLTNLWVDDASNIVDSDPIDLVMPDDIGHMVVVRDNIIAFGRSGKQIKIGAIDTPLTPESTRWDITTANDSIDKLRPAVMRHNVYFVGQRKNASQMYEYAHDALRDTEIADDISKHVTGYLPMSVQSMVASPNNDRIFLCRENDDRIWVYSTYWSGDQRAQAAWTTYHLLDGALLDG